jgi:mannose-1-phosphate guanylyltransferase/phosphomannomutase
MFESFAPRGPLPGTRPNPRGLFIDRWGTLLELPPSGSPRSVDDLQFRPGALDALFRASQEGWKLYLIGNEEAVAFGELSDAAWAEIEAALLETLEDYGIPLTRNYACLDHPRGRGKHRNDSVYFLPNTGAFYHASHFDGLEIERSWVIGDSTLELAAGWRAGLKLAAVRSGLALSDGRFEVAPQLDRPDLVGVLAELAAAAPLARR